MRSRMPEVVAIVQLLFGKLGWNFNEKCVFEPSTVALYNGMWIDSARFEIRAPHEKIETTRKLAWTIWFKARDGEQVRVLDLQRLAGRLQSIKLAVEGVAVWTRGLYCTIARAQEEHGGPPPPGATTYLNEAAMTDIWFWALRMGKKRFNGQPLREFANETELTMQSDAGDLGWGAHSEDGPEGGWQQHGELPADTLDESSTVREITGLMLATKAQTETLRGKQVCIRMDSYPATRNLINGGGPVERINSLVREWRLWCREHAIKPRYEWVPREENTLADDLSKRAARSHELLPKTEKEIRDWLVEQGEPGVHRVQWLRTNIRVPEFDMVRQRLEEMIRARRPGCIVVPAWGGQLWWNTLKRYSSARLRIGTARRTLASYEGSHDPSTEAHLIVPGLRAATAH